MQFVHYHFALEPLCYLIFGLVSDSIFYSNFYSAFVYDLLTKVQCYVNSFGGHNTTVR